MYFFCTDSSGKKYSQHGKYIVLANAVLFHVWAALPSTSCSIRKSTTAPSLPKREPTLIHHPRTTPSGVVAAENTSALLVAPLGALPSSLPLQWLLLQWQLRWRRQAVGILRLRSVEWLRNNINTELDESGLHW
eukprot:EG_transcript_31118